MAIVAQSSKFSTFGRPVLAWAVGLLFFFPIFWLFMTSLKTDADAVKPEYLLFFTPTLENYLNMTQNYDYWRFATNSVVPRSSRQSSLSLLAFRLLMRWLSIQVAGPKIF